MDAKLTLKKLHERFPEMSLDDLFAILECIEEPQPYVQPIIWDTQYLKTPDYTVTCAHPSQFGGQVFQTVSK